MRRAGGSLWRARAGLGGALQSQLQPQHARSYARSVVLSEEEGQQRVVEASLTLVRELARLKADHVRKRGGAIATSCMLGVPLGHNSSFLQVRHFPNPISHNQIKVTVRNRLKLFRAHAIRSIQNPVLNPTRALPDAMLCLISRGLCFEM